MNRPREPFSVERHQDVAAFLVRLQQELRHLEEALDGAYGESAADEARQAADAVDRVREMLDGQFSRDYPTDPDMVCNIRLRSIYSPLRLQEGRRASH
jgi:hypothetical protein